MSEQATAVNNRPRSGALRRLRAEFVLVRRTLWYGLYYFFARHLPVSYRYQPLGNFSKWCRALAAKRLFRYCGERVNIEHGADFFTGWEVEIGDDSSLGINCMVPFDLKVGRDVMMGPNVFIAGDNHEFAGTDRPMRLQGKRTASPVRIEDDVWIGANVIILSGLTIGKGSILGAGAVVTKNVPPYAICAGNPARIIRFRSGEQEHANQGEPHDYNSI